MLLKSSGEKGVQSAAIPGGLGGSVGRPVPFLSDPFRSKKQPEMNPPLETPKSQNNAHFVTARRVEKTFKVVADATDIASGKWYHTIVVFLGGGGGWFAS